MRRNTIPHVVSSAHSNSLVLFSPYMCDTYSWFAFYLYLLHRNHYVVKKCFSSTVESAEAFDSNPAEHGTFFPRAESGNIEIDCVHFPLT